MKTRFLSITLAAAITAMLLALPTQSRSQSFVNLDFESVTRPSPPGNAEGTTQELLPGWGLSLDGQPVERLFLDYEAPGLPFARLISTDFIPENVFQGEYTLYLDSGPSMSNPSETAHYHLSQTGMIPEETMSLRFQGMNGLFDVSVDGIHLELFDESPNDRWYAADVTSFAGRSVTLAFTTTEGVSPFGMGHVIDDIQFSVNPAIPEPGPISMIITGAGVLWLFSSASRPMRNRRHNRYTKV